MPKYSVRIQKVNYGIQIELLSGRLGKNALIAMDFAYTWWKKQVIGSTFTLEWLESKRNYDSDYPPKRESSNVKNLPSKKILYGYEPVGFVVDDFMGDSGSRPTETRKELLKKYQRPLKERRDGKNIYFWTDLEIRLSQSGEIISITKSPE